MKQAYMKKNVVAYIVPALTIGFFVLLIGIAVFSVRYKTKQFSGDAMASDITQLAAIFKSIHEDCVILSFDYQKNSINFLNVESFAGSEVGPMNVAHPENWKGPYVDDNLAMQNKEYQIVRTDAGYFIVPGEDVKLPNGSVMGKDILLDKDADIAQLTQNGEPLNFEGKRLAAQILLNVGNGLFDLNALDLDDLAQVPMGD